MLRVIAGLIVTLVAATAGWWWLDPAHRSSLVERDTRPIKVEVVSVVSRPFRDTLPVVGTAQASRAVVLLSEVAARVETVHFREGEDVEAGDLLVTLDDRAARVVLNRTRTEYQRALSDYQRASRESEDRIISETAMASLKSTMESARASMESAQASLDNHRLQAPFDGVVGLRQVDEGAFLEVGEAITTLDSLRNLEVNFPIAEHYLAEIRPGLTVEVASDTYPGKTFRGKLLMLDTRLDPINRSLTAKTILDNRQALLRPGELLQVSIVLAEHSALWVPEQSVITEGSESYVFTVVSGNVAQRLPVKLGGHREGWTIITDGLQQAKTVVVKGHQYLSSGMPVTVVDDGGALVPLPHALLKEPV